MPNRFLVLLLLGSNLLWSQQSVIDSLPQTSGDSLETASQVIDSLPPLKNNTPSDFIEDIPLTEAIQDSIVQEVDSIGKVKDSLKMELKKKKKKSIIKRRYIPIDTLALINNYKVFYEDGSTATVDTSLTLQKDYKFNFLRQDYFELLPLSNVAQGFSRLGYDFLNQPLQPIMGARINHYGFFESDDIPYFQVPTPLTELFFRTTFKQGELVDALVTVNTSPKLNFMVSYKGLRSLGNYQNSRANGGQFRGSVNYNDAEERYQLRSHFVAQTRENQVNGGLNEDSIYFFENAPYYQEVDNNGNPVFDDNGDPVEIFYDGFLDRARLGNNMRGQSILSGRRFYLGQKYRLNNAPADSLKQGITIGNRFTYEKRFYEFSQSGNKTFFGDIDETIEKVYDRSDLKTITNETFIETKLPIIGHLKTGLMFNRWAYSLGQNDTASNTLSIGQQVNQLALFADWENQLGAYTLRGKFHHAFLADVATRHYEVEGQTVFLKNFSADLGVQYRSQPQNFNFYQYQSDYIDLNWDQTDLKNTKRLSIYARLNHNRWFEVDAQWHQINNFTYLRNVTRLSRWGSELLITPTQSQDQLEYLKLRLSNEISLGKFSLNNTVQYQRVVQIEADRPTGELGEPILLSVPKWITRNTLAFSSQIFKKALFLQTGFHFQFFTGFYADAIHSVLGEYVTQNNKLIGEYPRVDFFANAKISQTRVFFKVEHLNNSISGYRYYVAPFFPYRDLSIRFGVVWNFFQ